MIKNIIFLTTQLIILCLILSCSGKDNVTVYVAGYENNGNVDIAKIWKNGRAESLSDGTISARANSVYVSGTDVYVAGNLRDRIAKLWINGVGKILANEKSYAHAKSVVLSGSDILVAGSEMDNDRSRRARYWKNGKRIILPQGSDASSIAVLGEDVYVVGYDRPSRRLPVAKMWKNGKAVYLTNGKHRAKANSIYIIDNNL